jgi:hypothetical protein
MGFASFPEFTTLTYKDREEYERLIKDYPAVADFSFAFLMGWWALRAPVEISLLEGNVILSYCSSEKTTEPELCFIGTNKVDECLCTIFDYMRREGKAPKLAHIPEFVIDSMGFPEMFSFKPARSFDEYIIPLSKYYPLSGSPAHHKRRVASFLDKLEGARVNVGPVDLSKAENQELLLNAVRTWPRRGINGLTSTKNGAMENAIRHADDIGFKNVCLFLNDELHCFMIFYAPQNGDLFSLEYIEMSYAVPNLLNFSVNMFAEWFAEQGMTHVNMGMDFGKPVLRVAKLALQPVNFFRKYTIEPAYADITTRALNSI